MAVTEEQYHAALEVVKEEGPKQIQVKEETGEWRTIGASIRGRAAAYKELEKYRAQHPNTVLRVISKIEADKYLEGLAMGLSLEEEDDENEERRYKVVPHSGMHMPDPL